MERLESLRELHGCVGGMDKEEFSDYLEHKKQELAKEANARIHEFKASEVDRHLQAWIRIKQQIKNFENEANQALINRLGALPRAGTSKMFVEAPGCEPVFLRLSWTNPAVRKAIIDLQGDKGEELARLEEASVRQHSSAALFIGAALVRDDLLTFRAERHRN